MKITLPTVQHKSDFVAFSGGLDVITPAALVQPGYTRNAQNIEEDINGGYATLSGYERYSGQASPSDAIYWALTFNTLGTIVVGDTIVGATSGASGKVIAIESTRFILTKVIGTFASSESTVSGSASVAGPIVMSPEIGELHAQYSSLAADAYRSDIAAVPGEGAVLGVGYHKGVLYAFRNKVGTGVGMYKATATGWQAVSMGYYVSFDTGSGTAPVVGDTIAAFSPTAAFKLVSITVESGSFGAGTAAGKLYFTSYTGALSSFVPGLGFSMGITATCTSAGTAITIPNKDGRFEIISANFSGYTGTKKMYGVDGANDLFEYDGSVFVQIPIGLPSGAYPLHIAEHQNHLFVSYLSSVMHSALGAPRSWSTTSGAAEIAVGDDVVGFKSQPGADTTAAIAIYCRNKTKILYGTDAASWTAPVNFSDEFGAIPYSIQKVGETYVLDDRGVTSLSTTRNYGNFAAASLSKRVKPWLAPKRRIVTDSHIARDKQQYRIFFSDGTGAYFTIDNSNPSTTPAARMLPVLFPNPVMCSVSSEVYGGGDEVIFFGSDNGFVYQMEKGTSFDGAAIEWYSDLVFNNSKMYRALKKYRRLTFEAKSEAFASFKSRYSLGYASADIAQPDYIKHATGVTVTSYWDSFTWDSFTWDGALTIPLSMSIDGDGENISIRIEGSSNYSAKLTFSGAFIEFTPLRMLR
ncbi:conserved hypothetical protein [Gammaproteobacteria bacterium]